MKNKPYGLGIMVGRFQTLHTGHQFMIDAGLDICDTVGIFVGSSQESGTFKNPFTYELRESLLKTLYGDRIQVYPLPDIGVGNNSRWGDYVLENVNKYLGKAPDLFISGKESRRADWLSGESGLSIAELYVPKTIEISASEMRRFFIDDNFEEWKKYTDPKIWDRYEQLKTAVTESKDNTDTASI